MPASTALGIPYPVPGDPPNVPGDLLALAAWIDAYLTNHSPARQVARSTALNVADSTDTHIVNYDLGSTYNVGDISYAAGIFTVGPSAGAGALYHWDFTALWPATSTSHSRQWWIEKNGADTDEGHQTEIIDAGGHGPALMSGGGDLVLADGDTVQIVLFHSAGSTLSVSPKFFSLVRVA